MRVARQSVLGAGKTPNWAGATPPLAAFSRPKTSWGRSSPGFEALPARTQDSRDMQVPLLCRAVRWIGSKPTTSLIQPSDDALEREGFLGLAEDPRRLAQARGKSMRQRILNSRNFVACLLAAATEVELYFELPFPGENGFLQVMAVRVPLMHEGLFYSHNLSLFTAPYTAYSTLLFGPHVFGLTVHQRIRAGKLPPYPDPSKRNDLFLVVGEIHNQRQSEPSETPHWLTLPEGALFTGAAIVGAIGSGKTSCCMYPFAEQILYRASDKIKALGRLVLGVKEGEENTEVGLGSEYRYNPLHNDLDAYALAYNIASVLNDSSASPRNALVAGIHEPRQIIALLQRRTTVSGEAVVP